MRMLSETDITTENEYLEYPEAGPEGYEANEEKIGSFELPASAEDEDASFGEPRWDSSSALESAYRFDGAELVDARTGLSLTQEIERSGNVEYIQLHREMIAQWRSGDPVFQNPITVEHGAVHSSKMILRPDGSVSVELFYKETSPARREESPLAPERRERPNETIRIADFLDGEPLEGAKAPRALPVAELRAGEALGHSQTGEALGHSQTGEAVVLSVAGKPLERAAARKETKTLEVSRETVLPKAPPMRRRSERWLPIEIPKPHVEEPQVRAEEVMLRTLGALREERREALEIPAPAERLRRIPTSSAFSADSESEPDAGNVRSRGGIMMRRAA